MPSRGFKKNRFDHMISEVHGRDRILSIKEVMKKDLSEAKTTFLHLLRVLMGFTIVPSLNHKNGNPVPRMDILLCVFLTVHLFVLEIGMNALQCVKYESGD
ncbi:unnamed protein product [Clavelina lepadiformis]|uniref:Uncharacterized protein n=1 Tax=Clavelina lepadiformis TaxID=159417 RepID=A0ABP0G1K6_CLALP